MHEFNGIKVANFAAFENGNWKSKKQNGI